MNVDNLIRNAKLGDSRPVDASGNFVITNEVTSILNNYQESITTQISEFEKKTELLCNCIDSFTRTINDNSSLSLISNFILTKYCGKIKNILLDTEDRLNNWIDFLTVDILKREELLKAQIKSETIAKKKITEKIDVTFTGKNLPLIKKYFNVQIEEEAFNIKNDIKIITKKESFFNKYKHTIGILIIEVILLSIKTYTLYTGNSGAALVTAIFSGCLGLILIILSGWLFKLNDSKKSKVFYLISLLFWLFLILEPIIKPAIPFDFINDKLIDGLYEYSPIYISIVFILFIILIVVSKVLEKGNTDDSIEKTQTLNLDDLGLDETSKVYLSKFINIYKQHIYNIKKINDDLDNVNKEILSYNNIKTELEKIYTNKKIEIDDLVENIKKTKSEIDEIIFNIEKIYIDIFNKINNLCLGIDCTNAFNKELFINQYKLQKVYKINNN